jgi:hypothetical protein
MPRPLSISAQLEALAIHEIPEPFGQKMAEIRRLSGEMKGAAAELKVKRHFTPDGRLLGDIGEVIAKIHWGVTLHGTQQEGQDGVCSVSGHSVEVKLRSKSSLIWVTKIPRILAVIYLSPVSYRWGVVCNGDGRILLQSAAYDEGKKHYVTDLSKLIAAQALLPPDSLQLSVPPA